MSLRSRLIPLLAGILAVGALLVFSLLAERTPAGNTTAVQPLEIAFIGTTEDADCILLWQPGYTMMIDTGEEADGDAILGFLEDEGIDRIDLLVLTHPDKDHIGSAARILEAVEVGTLLEPDYTGEKKRLEEVRETADRLGVPREQLTSRWQHTAGALTVTVYPPERNDYDGENNYSLATLVEHGQVAMLFPGDAKNKRLSELMDYDWPADQPLQAPPPWPVQRKFRRFLAGAPPRPHVVTASQPDETLRAIGTSMGNPLVQLGRTDGALYKRRRKRSPPSPPPPSRAGPAHPPSP